MAKSLRRENTRTPETVCTREEEEEEEEEEGKGREGKGREGG